MTTIDTSVIQKGLGTVLLKPQIIVLEAVDSTNSYARGLLARESSQDIVVIAESQRAGRGRFNRYWHSPVGGLYMSLAMKPRVRDSSIALLGLLAGCAAATAIHQMTTLDVGLKWPNDIMICERKVGGILSEAISVGNEIFSVILGIGINQNMHIEEIPAELREKATTIMTEFGVETSREELAYRIVNNIDARLAVLLSEPSAASVLDEWMKMNVTIGRKVQVNDGQRVIRGTAVGIMPTGSLRLKVGTRYIEIQAGDILHN
jgi:BirA family biotin operon repressor/biotin-[acetyl-CoA-carboxylase] ligase